MAMLGNLVAMVENVMNAWGGKMAIMETFFVDLG